MSGLDEKGLRDAIFPNGENPLWTDMQRGAVDETISRVVRYLALATPADVGEEPVAWQWRSKGWSVDDKWSEWLCGRKPPERKFDPHDYEERQLYSATAAALHGEYAHFNSLEETA